ncbi:MAG TPA: division plane positioning ATPase MipZ [Bauldia sp.]|nr:division plane positioning ATPase MipZ [Bauldia sp.]
MGLRAPRPGHIIVLGNEKGGSGKSTTAMHIVVALLKAGRSVASIDTDGRQRSLTRYIENRAVWRAHTGLALELPTHFTVPPADGDSVGDIELQEFRSLAEAISRVEYRFEFVVIDTPGSNSHLMRVSHAMADTLITPINDSFVDFDVIARVDPLNYEMTAPSHYAELVADARRQRDMIDGHPIDWVVIRNRLAALDTRNRKNVARGLDAIAGKLGFRIAEGISERVVFREFFLRGLTALDTLDEQTLGAEPTMSHLAARREINGLIDSLNLPIVARKAESRVPAA